MKRYSLAEDAYIRTNWRTTDDGDMADHLGRSVHSVVSRRLTLGLNRDRGPNCRLDGYASPIVRPDPPRGIQPEAVIWARMNPTHPEARLILGGYAERDLCRPSREGERAWSTC